MERLKIVFRFGSIALKNNSLTKCYPKAILTPKIQKILIGSQRNIFYQFSTNQEKPPKPNNNQQLKADDEKPQQENQANAGGSSTNDKKQMEQLTQQQLFNLVIGLEKNHSFKNDLVVSQDKYNRQIKQLKEAILFQDLLKKEIDILIYDTEGKPYFQHLVRTFFLLVSIFGTIFFFYQGLKTQKKFRIQIEKTVEGKIFSIFVKLICGGMLIVAILKHLRMTKRYVEKIIYHTENESFTFIRRKVYGKKYEQKISRFKILYTENPALVKRGTNYINIENQHQYRIGYIFAWKKEDLFSHLISQRIRT